jgi:hypothetical protein
MKNDIAQTSKKQDTLTLSTIFGAVAGVPTLPEQFRLEGAAVTTVRPYKSNDDNAFNLNLGADSVRPRVSLSN